MSSLVPRLREQQGEGLIVTPLLLAGVLVPLLLLVPLYARLELARLSVEAAARDAARAAAQAPSQTAALDAARRALARAQVGRTPPLRLSLTGRLERGATIIAHVSALVPLTRLPGLGQIAPVTVRAQAASPVDRYRSFDPAR